MLPESPKGPLQDYLKQVTAVYQQDVVDGWSRVQLPHALDRKYPTRRRTDAGNGSFPRNTDGSMARLRNKVTIILTNPWCRKPSEMP